MNLKDAIAANRAREAAKRDVTLASGKKVTHTRQPNGSWLVNEELSRAEWLEYVGVVERPTSKFATEADRDDFYLRR